MPYEEDPRGYQSPDLHQIVHKVMGDTPGAAVYERRCVKEPMGCGKPYEGVCHAEFGGQRPCVEAKNHTGDHTDQDNYGGNMAVWTTFRSQKHFDEWTLVGMCQECQDRMDEAVEAEAIARGEDPGPSMLDHTFTGEQQALHREIQAGLDDSDRQLGVRVHLDSEDWPDEDYF